MKKLAYIFTLLLPALCLVSCNDDKVTNLVMDGDTYITSLSLEGYDAEIDNVAKTAVVGVPYGYDASAMKVSGLQLSPGATANLAMGQTVDCSVPRNIRVSNGSVYSDYMLTVAHDNATFVTFTIDNKYQGTVDNLARTIQVFVPRSADVSSMLVTYTLNEGATATPASGSMVDFTDPVVFKAVYRSAEIDYTVTVVQDDMSQDPKAFVGNAENIESLGDEARAAAEWMMANVPNCEFVSLQSVLDGTVKLSSYKMIWCHFDWTDWPGVMWDTRDLFNDYYIKGGNILASRDGARYINDVWRIALDQQCPNNMYGGDSAETLEGDLGFGIAGHEDHELYAGLPVGSDGRIVMVSAGCSNTNRTLQWGVDWDPYGSMEGWEQRTGAVALASDNGCDPNRATIAEFRPREVLKGYQSGTVLTVGTPAFEWYQASGVNTCRPVIEQFTKNAINYLCK